MYSTGQSVATELHLAVQNRPASGGMSGNGAGALTGRSGLKQALPGTELKQSLAGHCSSARREDSDVQIRPAMQSWNGPIKSTASELKQALAGCHSNAGSERRAARGFSSLVEAGATPSTHPNA